MNDPIKTIQLENHITANIYVDDNRESPREWDNLGTMVCWHNRYKLGDEQPRYDPETWLHYEVDEFISDKKISSIEYQQYENDRIAYLLDEFSKRNIVLPLYLYDHSGITMNTTGFRDRWDSGQVGFIYVSKEAVRNEYGWKRLTSKRIDKIESYLKQEVKTYDDYLTGNVYGFELVCDNCEAELDSCWGFFGDDPEQNGMTWHWEGITCNCEGKEG